MLLGTNLTDLTKSRLNEISKIEIYINLEINKRKLFSKKLSIHVAAFEYTDKVLIVLSATSIHHFVYDCCGSSCWNSKGKFYSVFFFNNKNSQKIIKHNKK